MSRNRSGHILGIPRNLIVMMISLYQRTLSPDHGPLRHLYPYGYCRHYPTCSEYGKRVVHERGALAGSMLLIGRVLTCHPWRTPDDRRMLEAIKKHG